VREKSCLKAPTTATEAVDAAECTAIPYSFHATKGGFGGVEGLEAGSRTSGHRIWVRM